MSLIKVVPYVLGMTPGVPGAPEPRMYFLVFHILETERMASRQKLDTFLVVIIFSK